MFTFKNFLPTIAQWKHLPGFLSKKEKIFLFLCCCLVLISSAFLSHRFYAQHTKLVPAIGDRIVEGVAGFPRFLNPVYSEENDVDRDLVQLLFSGLLRYNEKGTLIPDLAKDFTIQEGGKVFEFVLKDNIQWHDGHPFSADDVIFTIQTIQDPKYKSPIRTNWVGAQLEKISDFKVRFKLPEPYAPFLERLTVKIIPAHIWQEVPPENFPLMLSYNLQHGIPSVGTGPYRMTQLIQEHQGQTPKIKEIHLTANQQYHGNQPFIQQVIFKFFDTEEELFLHVEKGVIQTLVKSSHPIPQHSIFSTYSFSLPRYFAIFFNLNPANGEDFLKNKEIRQALEYAIDKNEIIQDVFQGRARIVASPVLPEIFGFPEPSWRQEKNLSKAMMLLEQQGYKKDQGKIVKVPLKITNPFQSDLREGSVGEEVRKLQECLARDSRLYPEGTASGIFGPATRQAVINFQEKYAKDLLLPQGLSKGTGKTGPATRTKLNELCAPPPADPALLNITLVTLDQPPLTHVAQVIKKQWEELGIQTKIRTYPLVTLQQEVMKPRNYQALLFGESLGKIPDPFPFWHSSQKKDPGLNFSSYENKTADKLLEEARKEIQEDQRTRLYANLQNLIIQDTPAVFLYDTDYAYMIPKAIQGIREQSRVIPDPSHRFDGIEKWYIKTKRVWR